MTQTSSRCRVWRRAWWGALLAILPLTAALAATQYLYDDAGRLVLVTSPEQGSIVYEYDANGNRTAIHQWPPTALRITNFLPSSGHAGQAITVYGDNFDANPAANALTIGGVVATVTATTPNTLSSTIPYGAATGPISVTVDGVTATSAQSLIIKLPTITSFAPAVVNPGMAVTAVGGHLNLVPGSTSMAVAGAPVTITSLSNAQATFTAPSNSGGPITVATSYGQGVSASNLVVIPSSVNATNVVDHAAVEPAGSSAALSINAQNKYAVLAFDAVAGQYLSIQIASITSTPNSGSVAYQVFSPTGASFASGSIAVASGRTIHLPVIATSGHYVVSFASGTKTSLQITAAVEVDQWLDTGGVSLSAATAAPGQNKRFLANLTAGDDVGFALRGLALAPSSPTNVVFRVKRPNGQNLNSGPFCGVSTSPGCSYGYRNVPDTGAYQVVVEMQGLQNASYTLTLSHDVTGTLTAGTPLSVDLDVPGRQAWLSFTTTATQTMALGLSSVATTPSGKSVSMAVYNSSGSEIASGGGTSTGTLNLTNLAAGTYNVLLQPSNTALATMSVTLADELGGSLPTDGTSQSFSTAVPGQNGYFTFTANAGDDLGLALTGLTLTPTSPQDVVVRVKRPNGQNLNSGPYCSRTTTPGCSYSFRNVPDTGAYQVIVEMQGVQHASYTLTVSQNVTGTLTAGTPLSVSLDVPGRQGWLSFTTTATQTMALGLSSVATTPSGKNVSMLVYNASGTQIASGGGTSIGTLNLTNLAAGTYYVLLQPSNAALGTMSVTLANGLVGALPTDGTSQSFSTAVPGQNAYFTFTANAGDDLGLALTGLTLTPTSPQNVIVRVLRPNGQSALGGGGQFCSRTTTPGCSYSLRNVPDTGTYQVLVEMQGVQSASYTLTVSQNVTGTLTAGTPLSVTLDVPGRQGWLSFTTPAVQTMALGLSSVATTPSGRSVAMRVYNASGSEIASGGGSSISTLNLTNLAAGTYDVLLQPNSAETGTMSVKLANGLVGSLPTDGTSQSISTGVPGQNGYFTFTADAGDDLGLAVTGLTLTPTSPQNVVVRVLRPNGQSALSGGGQFCSRTTTPGCSYALRNVPDTGTYQVLVEMQGLQDASYSLTLSHDVTGTLSPGSPLNVNLDVPGRQGWLSFTTTAVQTVTLNVSSIATTPTGRSVSIFAYNASGTQIGSTSGSSTATLNMTNLAVGTYNVLLQPSNTAMATLTIGIP